MLFSRRLMYVLCLLVTFFAVSCQEEVNPAFREEVAEPELYHRSVKQLTDVIVHDIFSPPVAARIYAYSSLAGYEALAAGDDELPSYAGRVPHLTAPPAPPLGTEISYEIAAVAAQLEVGKSLIFSENRMQQFADTLMLEIDDIGVPDEVLFASIDYGHQVAQHIKGWYDGDMYKQTRTFPKYSITEDPGKWQPTPPDYMDGIEPSWMKIRPFTLIASDQFRPAPPTEFNADEDSDWFAGAMEVYTVLQVDDIDERAERIAIAKFWDCNPYVSHHNGHMKYATKKITPGGHWVNITAIASRKANADFASTVGAYALVSMAMHDAFISCWDEKYRSNLIRPETFINRQIDPEWAPLLQTPPFPEHTSGHSVVSRACAVVLTEYYGDDFGFVDDSEVEYGLPARSYASFLEASEEAAISRLYGGIHYMPAITEGVLQGEAVGHHVLSTLGKGAISK